MSEERTPYNAGPIREACFNPFPIWEKPEPDEVRSLIAQLGLSNAQLANLVGVNDGKQVRRWKAGQARIPFAVWGMMAALVGRPECIDQSAFEFVQQPFSEQVKK